MTVERDSSFLVRLLTIATETRGRGDSWEVEDIIDVLGSASAGELIMFAKDRRGRLE